MTNPTKVLSIKEVSLLAILMALGCGSGAGSANNTQPEEQSGEIFVALTSVPVADTCLVLTYTGSTTTTSYTHFAAAGTSTASLAVKLNIGTVNVVPVAYTNITNANCNSGGVGNAPPAWFGPSVTVNVLPGTPTQIPVTLHPYNVDSSVDFSLGVKEISSTFMTSYALLTDGTVRAWGSNGDGQLGNNTPSNHANPVPVTVTNASMGTVIGLGVGSLATHMCAINNAGSGNNLYCWGSNSYGQLGNNTRTNSPVPVAVSGTSQYAAVALAYGMTWGIQRSSGVLWAWGDNEFGQYGTGSTTSSNVPVSTGTVVEQVSGAYSHMVARTGPVVWGTGYNDDGRLGTGDTTSITYLTGSKLAEGMWPISVATGESHTCVALTPNGAVQCTGLNNSGQLGDGTTTSRALPVTVAGLTGVIAVSAGFEHTCALKNNGTIWCWGYNDYGQLGDGTSTNRLTPTQVVGITDARAVSAGLEYTCALRNDATVWCWGYNDYGQLGDGTTIPRGVPTKVLIQ